MKELGEEVPCYWKEELFKEGVIERQCFNNV